MCTLCKDPGLSGYRTWYSCRYVCGQGPTGRQDMDGHKTSWNGCSYGYGPWEADTRRVHEG